MDKQHQDDRPFKGYSNLIVSRSEKQGIFFEISQPCLITVWNDGKVDGHPDSNRICILSPRHVRIVRSEIAPPIAQQMLDEINARAEFSRAKKRAFRHL